jgi:hypothetical protein
MAKSIFAERVEKNQFLPAKTLAKTGKKLKNIKMHVNETWKRSSRKCCQKYHE